MNSTADSRMQLAERLVEELLSPDAYEHPAPAPELVETHISWVILAGDYVYKIKKPLELGFLDFGSLEKRRHFCEEELRLNHPSAPSIYLRVVPVTRVAGRARMDGPGEPIEFALCMRRFDPNSTLDRQLADGLLTVDDMKELGRVVAQRHAAASRVPAGQRERYLELTGRFMWDNFVALDGVIDGALLEPLRDWTRRELDEHAALIADRFDTGRVRDCHGDLHLGNLVRLPDGITTFDCIEFDGDLRAIDVICDIAFLVMDLVARDRPDLATHFLNRYLEAGGDYEGAVLLDLFFVYRCLVRAKVAVIRAAERDDPAEREADLVQARRYAGLARRQSAKGPPLLVVMHGLSGSGKTWVSGALMAALPAIRIRSDIERRRLVGLAETAASGSGVGTGIYGPATGRQVYARLLDLAERLLRARHSVILDAAFLRRDERSSALAVARLAGSGGAILAVVAPDAVMRQRIAARRATGTDASEADQAVLDFQLARAEPLSDSEKQRALVVDNQGPLVVADLAARIRSVAGRAR